MKKSVHAMKISARNLLSAQGVGREDGRSDTSLFYICSGAHAAELNLPIEKIPMAGEAFPYPELDQDPKRVFFPHFICDRPVQALGSGSGGV